MKKKKNYVEFDIREDGWDGIYGTKDICDGFDHSYGVFSGAGLFCWTNRYGKKTFANSNRDGRLDLLVICKDVTIEVITGWDCEYECDDEHVKDGKPHFQTPSIEDLVPFVTRLKIEGPQITFDEAGYLISHLLTPCNGVATQTDEKLYWKYKYSFPEEFTERARTMPYKDFLQTPYWRLFSDEIKSKRRACQLCGSSKNLEVHHVTYDIRGEEPWHTDKLQVLCHKCHSKVHGKEK